MNTTTRTFHRSLAQAYPKDHAAAIQIHRKPKEPLGWRIVNTLAAILLIVGFSLLALGY